MDQSLAFITLPFSGNELWTFIVLGSVAALIVGVAKAGFGGGIGILASPIMIYACGEKTTLALGVLLPILMTCDAVSVISWRGKWDTAQLKRLMPGAVTGILAGSCALWWFTRLESADKDITEASLKLGIGVIALIFVALQSLRSLRKTKTTFRPAPWHGAAVGSVAGFTSTLSHGAGPIVSMFLLPQQMPKGRFVATTVLFFWFVNLVKLPPYGLIGMIDTESIQASVVLMPAVVVGALLGVYLHHRVGQKSFIKVVYVLLALTGTHLSYKAILELVS